MTELTMISRLSIRLHFEKVRIQEAEITLKELKRIAKKIGYKLVKDESK